MSNDINAGIRKAIEDAKKPITKDAPWSYCEVRKGSELVDTKAVYINGLITVSLLTDEEAHMYRKLIPGVWQTNEMIQWVAENEEEKQIIEITATEMNRIRVRR